MYSFDLIIGGQETATHQMSDVTNPANGNVIGRAPVSSVECVDKAIDAAQQAFLSWRNESHANRQEACRKIAAVLQKNSEELAQITTAEQGKPLNGMGSRFELGGCVAWAAHTAELSLDPELIQDDGRRIELHRKPIGVVASITPWNWPLQIAIWHLIPAILAGNTVVIKPSPNTPLATLRMIQLMDSVLPDGVVNSVCGDEKVGACLIESPKVSKIAFTGSTRAGRHIMGGAAPTLKRLTLELGGNDAGIVLPDANIPAIAENVFWGAFINNGQTCAALKRLYVHESVHDEMCDALVEIAGSVKVGRGEDEDSILGPLQNKAQRDFVSTLADEAAAEGATVLVGGQKPDGPGYFYPITLLSDVAPSSRVVSEEQFGPVLPILKYRNVDDAIAQANDSPFGLGGSVWGSDRQKAKAVSAQMECGSVWINSHGTIQPNAPFGGVKQSGIGVEFGKEGLLEFTTIQTMHIE